MNRLRVVVADDSLTVRRHLVAVLAADPALEVVGEAADGFEAIELCRCLRPDVLTVDLVMPGLDGLQAIEQIMAYHPLPILVVSSAAHRGEQFQTVEALAAGAVEALDKAAAGQPDGEWERRFVSTVKLVSRIKVISHPRAKLGAASRPVAPPRAPRPNSGACGVVAIGASTGGPGAVTEILRQLPASFPVPILVVLHLGEPFGRSFADWLDRQTALTVRPAEAGQAMPGPGCVLVAPPEFHMAVVGDRVHLHDGPERHSCRPSVDVLFESIATTYGARAAGCLLTGMGRDGAAGLLAMRQAGGQTIAQDEATSVVFGMPREAIALGAALHVLPLGAIAPTLMHLAGGFGPLRST